LQKRETNNLGTIPLLQRRQNQTTRMNKQTMPNKQNNTHKRIVLQLIIPPILTIILFASLTFFFVLPHIKKNITNQKKQALKRLTENAWSILQHYHQLELTNTLSKEVAQQQAIDTIKNLRFGSEMQDYFWINDMHPRMIMHPYRPELNNTDLTGFTDPTGKHLFVEFIDQIENKDSGFVHYNWQWKNNPKKIVPKLSYVKEFQPWHWVIGTGIYLKDVEKEMEKITKKLIIAITITLIIVGIFLLYLVISSLKIEKERYKTASKLQISEQRIRTLFDQSFQSIALLDLQGKLIKSNQTILNFCNTTIENIQNKYFWEIPWIEQTQEQQNRFKQAVQKAASGEFSRYNITAIDKNKHIHDFDLSLKPVFDNDQQVIAIILEGRDISELTKAHKETQHLRNFLKNIIDSMPSILIGVDTKTTITQWNLQAEKITGYNTKTAIGKPLKKLVPFLKSEIENIHSAIQDRIIFKSTKETIINDKPTTFDITVYPLIANGIQGAVIIVDDISERIRIQEMMIQSQKMISLGELATGMAHEINNPLAGILQNMQVIQNRLSEKLTKNKKIAQECHTNIETITNYAQKRGIYLLMKNIQDAGMRATKIVKDMLNLGHKNGQEFKLHSITKIMEQSLTLAYNDYNLKDGYDFKQIKIEKQFATNLPKIYCDSGKIQQVFLNIIRNGTQNMLNNNIPNPTIQIQMQKTNDLITIHIKDNGKGMPENISKRIFEPFYTTKEVGQGTGLGLSIAFFIITKTHHGTLCVESTPNKGSTFTIHLPINRQIR